MTNNNAINSMIELLEERAKEESDKYILESLNFQIGYLVCMLEHNIKDEQKLESLKDYIEQAE